jgi:hypothetical protein
MKRIQWLVRVPKYLPFAIAWATEIAGGLILKKVSGALATPPEQLAFFVGSGILAHYIHLLLDHLRPTELDDLEKAVDHLEPKDGVGLNRGNVREALKTLVESGGAVQPEVVKTATHLVTKSGHGDQEGQQQIVRWLSLLERFDRQVMSRDFVRQLTDMLHGLKVPRQVESIFNLSLQKEVERMALLAAEQAVEKVDLRTQYVYASGVAKYYETRSVSSIYATAHDTPSLFYNDHEEYFRRQKPLLTNTVDFLKYSSGEVQNLRLIIGSFDGKAGRPARYGGSPAEKARIVIIRKDDLLKDLKQEKFWALVQWHAANHFGLKFFIRDVYADDKDDWYESELCNVTDRDPDHTIDDFIVYGDDCVFGRIYTKPDLQSRVSLGFHYLRQATATPGNGAVIPIYRDFFIQLWKDRRSHTLTELWDLHGINAKAVTERAHYQEVLDAYGAGYQAVLEQRQADRVSTT